MAFLAPLLGALIPGLISGGMSLFGGSKSKKEKYSPLGSPAGQKGPEGYNTFSTFNPQQEQVFNQLLSQLSGQGQGEFGEAGQSHLMNLLGGDTEAFEAPFMRQFNEQTIPALAERFAGAGAGAQSSSAFQQALGGAGADLQERLASLRGQLQLGAAQTGVNQGNQNISNLMNLLQTSTRGFVPKQQGFLQSALPGILQSLIGAGGSALGGYLGRPSLGRSPFGGS